MPAYSALSESNAVHLQLTLTLSQDKLKNTRKYFKNSILRNNGKLTVGFLGISHLAPALSKVGLDVALSCLNRKTILLALPHPVSKTVPTTIWSVGIRILPKQALSAMFQ